MLTLEVVAERYSVDVATVRGWIRKGLIPAFHVGHVTRIAEEDEELFRRAHTWHGAAGVKGHSASGQSSAGTANTSTGAQSYQAALSEIDVNTKRERNERRGLGSANSSPIPFRSRETA